MKKILTFRLCGNRGRRNCGRLYTDRALRRFLWIMAAFYGYGALMHLFNIAPLKWRIMNIVYLLLDAGIVVGILCVNPLALAGLVVAAASQIALYTILHAWLMDVPPEIAVHVRSGDLDFIVAFHVATLATLTALLLRLCARPRIESLPARVRE